MRALRRNDISAAPREAIQTRPTNASPPLPPRQSSRHDLTIFRRLDQQTTREILHKRAQQEVEPATVRTAPRSMSIAARSVCGPDSHLVEAILIDHRRDRVGVDGRAYQRDWQRRGGRQIVRLLAARRPDTATACPPCRGAGHLDATSTYLSQ